MKKMTKEKRALLDYKPNEVTYSAMESAENNEDMYGPFESIADLMKALTTQESDEAKANKTNLD